MIGGGILLGVWANISPPPTSTSPMIRNLKADIDSSNRYRPIDIQRIVRWRVVLFRQNLIRLREQRRRQVQAQASGSTLINCQVVSAGILDRQVARARALQDFINIAGRLAV